MNSRYTAYFYYNKRVILVSSSVYFMRSIIGCGLVQRSGTELCQKITLISDVGNRKIKRSRKSGKNLSRKLDSVPPRLS